MSYRTTSDLVKDVLRSGSPAADYEDSTAPDLTPFIATANTVTSLAMACAVKKGRPITEFSTVGDGSQAELIERWLAAAYYTRSDRLYTNRSTSKASGGFMFDGDELEKNPYIRTALDMDPSGCLNTLIKRRRASAAWLGKPPSEQVPYDQRS